MNLLCIKKTHKISVKSIIESVHTSKCWSDEEISNSHLETWVFAFMCGYKRRNKIWPNQTRSFNVEMLCTFFSLLCDYLNASHIISINGNILLKFEAKHFISMACIEMRKKQANSENAWSHKCQKWHTNFGIQIEWEKRVNAKNVLNVGCTKHIITELKNHPPT